LDLNKFCIWIFFVFEQIWNYGFEQNLDVNKFEILK
jgi:hypothetical protein